MDTMPRQKLFFPDGVSTSARKKALLTAVHCEKMEKGTFQLFEKSGVLVVFLRESLIFFVAKSPQFFGHYPWFSTLFFA